MNRHTPVERPPWAQAPRQLGSERGQGLAEYALILALIVLVAVVALFFLGTNISSILSAIAQSI